jgi:hypothetical protein
MLPLPLWEGVWGEGSLRHEAPPPNPLPQGEGGVSLLLPGGIHSFIQGGSAADRWSTRDDRVWAAHSHLRYGAAVPARYAAVPPTVRPASFSVG